MDFNDCVSKGELTAFITEQRNLMNELTCNVNNLVARIEQIEKCPQSHCGDDEDADGDLADHEDVDDDGDARNCRRYNFNRHGMGVNNHGHNDPFAKIKFSLPPLAGNVDSGHIRIGNLLFNKKLIFIIFLMSIELDLLLVSLLILLCFGGVIFAMLIMLLLCLKLGML